MNQQDQANAFKVEIERVLNRFIDEFELTSATAIGVLEMVKLDLYRFQVEDAEDDGHDYPEQPSRPTP